MRIRAEAISPAKKRTSVLCVFCFEDTNVTIGLGNLNKKIDQTISQTVKEINGKKGKISIIHSHKELPSERVLIAGLGKKEKLTSDVIRDVTGIITKKIHELKIKEFSIIIPENISIKNDQVISSIVEGANIVSPDYVSLRRSDDGYSTIGEQLDMQYKNDGSWEAHILDVKTRHPKSNAGSTAIEAIPAWVQEEVDKL